MRGMFFDGTKLVLFADVQKRSSLLRSILRLFANVFCRREQPQPTDFLIYLSDLPPQLRVGSTKKKFQRHNPTQNSDRSDREAGTEMFVH